MLLRASRASENLTKEALLGSVARFGGGLARGLFKAAPAAAPGITGRVGRVMGAGARRFWKPILGTAAVGAMTAPAIMQAAQKTRAGLSPQYIQAQKHGLVPRMRA